MTYRDFTFPEVEQQLGLRVREASIFASLPPLNPSPEFAALIADSATLAMAATTEKARSELVVSPVLFGLRRMLPEKFGMFSGVAFNVDPPRGLAGYCDFLLTRSQRQLVIEAPVVTIAEAKIDVTITGLGQCIAGMVAAREFNAKRNTPATVYGASTTGILWMFLRLAGDDLTIEPREYDVSDLPKVLGILKACVRDEVPA